MMDVTEDAELWERHDLRARSAAQDSELPPGLWNRVVSCYINCVIQALYSVDAYRDFFSSLSELDKRDCTEKAVKVCETVAAFFDELRKINGQQDVMKIRKLQVELAKATVDKKAEIGKHLQRQKDATALLGKIVSWLTISVKTMLINLLYSFLPWTT